MNRPQPWHHCCGHTSHVSTTASALVNMTRPRNLASHHLSTTLCKILDCCYLFCWLNIICMRLYFSMYFRLHRRDSASSLLVLIMYHCRSDCSQSIVKTCVLWKNSWLWDVWDVWDGGSGGSKVKHIGTTWLIWLNNCAWQLCMSLPPCLLTSSQITSLKSCLKRCLRSLLGS